MSEKMYRYLSGGLVGRDSSGDGRRVAFLECSDGTVTIQLPIHRFLGEPGFGISESADDIAGWLSAPYARTFVAEGCKITIDPAEGDAALGALSGVAEPQEEER